MSRIPSTVSGVTTDAPNGKRPERRSGPPRIVEVRHSEWLTPRMVRLTLGGAGLDGFDASAFTDHYVKLQLPPPGAGYAPPFDQEEIRATRPREQWPRTRTFTVREWDPDAGLITIDFVFHGDEGVAGPWAAGAKPGDLLQLRGPGGAYSPDPEADAYLLIGDPSVLPAIGASLARIPAGRPVDVLVQVADVDDELPLSSPGDLRLSWCHGDGDHVLLDALEALTWPAGKVDVFAHGEASAVRALRRHLIVERKMTAERMSVSGYWKRNRTDEGWREEKPEWNRLVEADVKGGHRVS